MAEARPHSLVMHLRSRGFNVSGPLAEDEREYVVIRVPLPSTMLRLSREAAVKLWHELNRSVWPNTPATLLTVVASITWATVQASSDSWLRSGWLADVLWRIDEALNPLRHRLSVRARVAYLAVIASGLGMLLIAASQRLLLRALLTWRGWAHAPRNAMPAHVKLWGVLVRSLAGGQSLGTLAFQSALPVLPLPWLARTVEQTLESLEPALVDQPVALENVRRAAASFLAREGPRLQRWLWLRHLTNRNYVTPWWEQYVYLEGRGPLVINSNYFVVDAFLAQPTTDQVFRAANVVFHMLAFEDAIADETLPPSLLRETVPLDMSQYSRMFGTTRIPGVERDTLQTTRRSGWIVVTRRGRFFKLLTRHVGSGRRLSQAELAHQLRVITEEVNFDRGVVDTTDIMALTALPRAQWARIREDEFLASAVNRVALDAIEKASFVVHLHDHPLDASPMQGGRKLVKQARALFHGDGASLWFDKSLQLVVFEDGRAGLNAEHAWGDAPMVSHMFEHALLSELHDVQAGVDASALAGESLRGDPLPIPTQLEFDVGPAVAKEAARARRLVRELAADVDLTLLEFKDFGERAIKTQGLSPDAVVQLALQLAYFRRTGRVDLVYESCTARLFAHGRTETIRSLTRESLALCRGMGQPGARELLQRASDAHASLSRRALTGDGVDRHLFALYVAAKGRGIASPFLDAVQAVPWRLSTSQQPQRQTALREGLAADVVANFFSSGGGFAPADDEGYGVAYTFGGPDRVFFHVTSRVKSAPKVLAGAFAAEVERALRDLMALCTGGGGGGGGAGV